MRIAGLRNSFARPGFRRMRSVSESQSDVHCRGGRQGGPTGRHFEGLRVRRLSGSGSALENEAGMSRANSLGDTRSKQNQPRERHWSMSKSKKAQTASTSGSKPQTKAKPVPQQQQQQQSGASCSSQAAGASCSSQAAGASSQTKSVPVTATTAGSSSQTL
jgi:hypothetical protein